MGIISVVNPLLNLTRNWVQHENEVLGKFMFLRADLDTCTFLHSTWQIRYYFSILSTEIWEICNKRVGLTIILQTIYNRTERIWVEFSYFSSKIFLETCLPGCHRNIHRLFRLPGWVLKIMSMLTKLLTKFKFKLKFKFVNIS